MQKCIFLMGPTASGKTKLAIDLVQNLPLEIISVDSAMIYRGMDIGTAKPTQNELALAPHHLINILDPSEHYSVGQFITDAKRLISDIENRGKIALFVGGTLLYFNALRRGLAALPERNEEIRKHIEMEATIKGWLALHEKLMVLDPKAAAKIKPNDKQRIERALEVYYLTNQPISALQASNQVEDLNILALALIPKERKILHERIKNRCEAMLKQGLIQEVRKLKERGDLSLDLASMRAVGYRQVWECLDGRFSETELLERMIIATRQYAKRQMTWLRAFPHIIPLDCEADDLYANASNLIQKFIRGDDGKAG